jgi:hypothetical protein
MPLAVLRDQVANTEVAARMPHPKRITSLPHWYREAQRVIKTLPSLKTGEWRLENEYVTEKHVAWEIVNTKDRKRLYLTIHRQIAYFG